MDRMWNGSKVVSSSFRRTVPGTSFTYSSVSRLGHKVGRYARSFRINHFRVEDLERGAFPSELLHSVSSVASSRRSESAISLARNDVGEFERRPSRMVRKRTYVSLAKFRVTTEREWTKDPARFLVGWIFNSTPRSIEFEARAVGLRAIEGFMRIDFP